MTLFVVRCLVLKYGLLLSSGLLLDFVFGFIWSNNNIIHFVLLFGFPSYQAIGLTLSPMCRICHNTFLSVLVPN